MKEVQDAIAVRRKIIANNISGAFLEKGGVGSGRRQGSLNKHKLLVSAHESKKKILENFNRYPPKDYTGKTHHVQAEADAARAAGELRRHIENHYHEHGELLDSNDHTINQTVKKNINKK